MYAYQFSGSLHAEANSELNVIEESGFTGVLESLQCTDTM